MTSKLLRCETLWGTCDEIAGPPALRRVTEAIYRPYRPDGAWGLFGEGGRLTEAGRDPADGEGMPGAEPVDLGPTLYLGPLVTHYGHFLINTLPRLWPLAVDGPRPRLLCHRYEPPGAWDHLEFLAAILGRLGYRVEDVESFDRPVRIAELIVPEPALREQSSVHAAFGDFCRRIGRPFWDEAEVDGQTRPVWLSKTRLAHGVAHIANEGELEAELARRGVEIVHPERLTFSEQVRLLSRRRIVMGSVGSAFHTTAFAAPGRRIVGLNWQLALNANFALVDRVSGVRARYYHPDGTRYRHPSVPDGAGQAAGQAGGGQGTEPGAAEEPWQVAWAIPDPRGTAAALLRRAERLGRDRPDPGRLVQAGERMARRLRTRWQRSTGG